MQEPESLADELWPPCRDACPVHADVRSYIEALAQGRWRDAIDIIRRNLPLASVCGRICHHPCEVNCRRGDVDEAVAIRELKRFVSELQGAAGATVHKAAAQDKARVAIVGGGPAGLSAALELAMAGYRPTIFEKFPLAGGIPATAVPQYRLPRDVLQTDVDWILAHGVDLRTGVEIGRDKTLDDLHRDGFAAVVIAVGLARSRLLPMPGSDHPRVYTALEFLTQVAFMDSGNTGVRCDKGCHSERSEESRRGQAENRDSSSGLKPLLRMTPAKARINGRAPELGRHVLVIGGGNVAVDAARTALRLGSAVRMVCLESEDEMPAFAWERREAREEGIEIVPRRGPTEIVLRGGAIAGVKARAVTRVFDKDRRFDPRYDDADVIDLACDTVIIAIGQSADLGFLAGSSLKADERGRIPCDSATQQTAVPWIFACGEIVTPPGSVVEACASGRRAAGAVDQFLSGRPLQLDAATPPKVEAIPAETAAKVTKISREPVPMAAAETRKTCFASVDGNLSEDAVLREARRCMSCGAGAEVIADKCAACLTCLRVCPFGIPTVTDVARIESAKCQSCGICIAECPANAIVARGWDARGLPAQARAAMNAAGEGRRIVALVCGHRSSAAQWQGRAALPPGVVAVYLPSLARVSVRDLLGVLEQGASAVVVAAVRADAERYPQATQRARRRFDQARQLVAEIGLPADRLQWVDLADASDDAVSSALAGAAQASVAGSR
jgi:NADPH-dependent glutamate synthase beta subunit-like oxidoreductase/coenzyme F420-reducing hydrogenase delta subunit/ferredoxin